MGDTAARLRACNKRIRTAQRNLSIYAGRPDVLDALRWYIRMTERERTAIAVAEEAWQRYIKLSESMDG